MLGSAPPSYYNYGDQNWRTPEVVLAPGPLSIGDTGNGAYATLYGYAYVGVLFGSTFRLFRVLDASGQPYSLANSSPSGGSLSIASEIQVPDGARHVALAFDQAAREVIAYEADGQVYVRQWDPFSQQYVLRGPFAGHDPVLTVDALMAGVEDSDVLLFYLVRTANASSCGSSGSAT